MLVFRSILCVRCVWRVDQNDSMLSPPAGLKTRLGMNFLRHSFVLINQLVLLDTSSYLFIVKCVSLFISINVMCSSGL